MCLLQSKFLQFNLHLLSRLAPATLYGLFCPCVPVLKLTNNIFPDVQETPLMKQLQTADSGEAEMETESPGGIFHRLFTCFPLLEFIIFTPTLFLSPDSPHSHSDWKSLVFLSHSICLVFFLCMVIVFQLLSYEQHLCRIVLPSLEHSF